MKTLLALFGFGLSGCATLGLDSANTFQVTPKDVKELIRRQSIPIPHSNLRIQLIKDGIAVSMSKNFH